MSASQSIPRGVHCGCRVDSSQDQPECGVFYFRLTDLSCRLKNVSRVVRLEGDPLEVAQWLQACHDAGMEVRVQVNESVTP
ncbi:hypothetical protein E5073_23965 [Escherichia coli]|nr:hypothetical protein [Escherichia coli]